MQVTPATQQGWQSHVGPATAPLQDHPSQQAPFRTPHEGWQTPVTASIW
jgi:hypothetical protein